MQFTAVLAVFAAFANSVNGLAIPPVARDVFVPPIISPNHTTTWVMGTQVEVTWNITGAPDNISNAGSVVLRKDGVPVQNGILARGFDLRAGFVTVDVPDDIESSTHYQITLFGDSGNISEEFTIRAG